MKKLVALLLAVLLLATLTACAKEKKTVHCDRCGAAVEIDADSNMEEDRILFCRSCAETMDPVVIERETPFN